MSTNEKTDQWVHEQCVATAFDALRILLGGDPKRYSSADIAAIFSDLARQGIGVHVWEDQLVPSLVEARQYVVKFIDDNGGDDCDVQHHKFLARIDAALAKARGEKS